MPLGKIGVVIILSVEFSIICQLPSKGCADVQHMPYRFPVDDRQGPWMCKAYRTDVYIGARLVGIVARAAEHLGLRFQLGVNLETDRWGVLTHAGTLHHPPPKTKRLSMASTPQRDAAPRHNPNRDFVGTKSICRESLRLPPAHREPVYSSRHAS